MKGSQRGVLADTMLCCTSNNSKRPRLEDLGDGDDVYKVIDKTPPKNENTLTPDIAEKMRQYDKMEVRLQQLEQLLLNGTFATQHSLVDLLVHMDENYAKKLTDIAKAQKENNQTVADILNVMIALTKYHDTQYRDLPDDCKKLCTSLQMRIRHEYRRFGIAMRVPEGVIDKIQGSNVIESFWNIIRFRQATEPIQVQELHDAFLTVKGIELDKAGEMPAVHLEIVYFFKSELYMDVVDAVVVLPYMRCFMYISPEIVQYVISPDAKIGRMANLIDVLPTLGHEALQVFTDALFHSGHEVLSTKFRKKAIEKGHPIATEPVPVPLNEADRILLSRKSRFERSQRVNDEIKELRQILMQKMQEQMEHTMEECTQF